MEPDVKFDISRELDRCAYDWWSRGFNIIPFIVDRSIKQPLTEWKQWEDRRQSSEEFMALPWDRASGFAVLCGRPNEKGLSVCVVDFDVKKTSEEAQKIGRKAIQYLPVTAREKTISGGEHHIYLSPKVVKTISSFHDSAALELLGEKKLCIMCPTNGYAKINDNLPSEIDDIEEKFYSALRKAGVKLPSREVKKRTVEISKKPIRPCFERLMQKEEMSHDERVALVIELEHTGHSEKEIKKIFHEHRSWEMEYDEEKTDKQIESILGRYGRNKRETLERLELCFDECPLRNFDDCRKVLSQDPTQYFIKDKKGRPVKFVPGWLGEDIKKDFWFATMRDNEDFYVYKNGIYRREAEVLIREEARRRLTDDLARESYVNETVAHIKETTYVDRKQFNNPGNLIATENGLLDVLTGELQPHTPEKFVTIKIPVSYNKDATCPRIMKFLSEVLYEEDIPIIQEMIGYCLLRSYPFAKAFMLLGPGENGKSTLLNLIEALLGEENVATPSLQDLLYNRFAKAELYNKLANIHADLPPTKLTRTGTFKMLTGQDTLYMERKHANPFRAKNHAKLIYSSNELPGTEDLTLAFFRRWILIKFPNTFPADDPNTDPHILEKLTTPGELSGFLNWALEGLQRLLKQGHFTQSRTREEIEREWIMRTDSLRAFVTAHVKVKRGSFITKKLFYEKYKNFCVENELEAVTMTAVGHRLPSIIPQTDEFKPLVDGKQQKAWKDICVTDVTNISQETERIITLSQFSLDEVVGCTPLKYTHHGECGYCGKKPKTLSYLVKTFKAHYFVCEDCGRKILKKISNGMEDRTAS